MTDHWAVKLMTGVYTIFLYTHICYDFLPFHVPHDGIEANFEDPKKSGSLKVSRFHENKVKVAKSWPLTKLRSGSLKVSRLKKHRFGVRYFDNFEKLASMHDGRFPIPRVGGIMTRIQIFVAIWPHRTDFETMQCSEILSSIILYLPKCNRVTQISDQKWPQVP